MARLRHDLGERPVTVDVAADLPLILVDAVLFDAIVSNILNNVVDHTPAGHQGGHLGATSGDAGIVVTIEDGGPGVADADLARIFDKFQRTRPPGEGARRGMGVGLSIVRGMADAIGGTATAHRVRARGPGRSASSCPRRRLRPTTTSTDDHARRRRPDRRGRRRDPPVRRGEPGRPTASGSPRPATSDPRCGAWSRQRPDLILLDLGLPDDDGLVIIRRVRRDATTPILVLSARDAEPDKVAALETGADDYVTKPFGLAELRARIGALLRRAGGPAADPGGRIVLGPVVIDVARRSVQVGSNPVELTPREYELLKTMFSQPGRLLTRGRLLRAVWGAAYGDEAHYLHVYVSRLRRKLDAADPTGTASGLIVAEPGVGYRIAEAETSRRVERLLSARDALAGPLPLGPVPTLEAWNRSASCRRRAPRPTAKSRISPRSMRPSSSSARAWRRACVSSDCGRRRRSRAPASPMPRRATSSSASTAEPVARSR